MVEKTYSFYTSNEEYIDYINEFWDESFAKYANNSLKRDISRTKQNRISNFLQDSLMGVFLIGLGCIMAIFSMYTSNLFVFVTSLFIGGFCVIYGLLCVYLEVLSKWKT